MSQNSRLRADGVVEVSQLSIPPSQLWSEEYRSYHMTFASTSSPDVLKVPARDAGKQAWKAFDDWWDFRYNAEPLERTLHRYPVHVENTTIAGVNAAIVSPANAPENGSRILISLHGGGFIYNRGLSFALREAVPIASIGRIQVVALDYRQAPFHTYPAASEDVEAVYRELLKRYAPSCIGLLGTSAGGTLVTQSLARFQSSALPAPAAVGVFSIAPMPFCDRPPWGHGWGDSGLWFSGVPKNRMSAADDAMWNPVRWYMETAHPENWQAYPGSSSAVLKRFPPTLFVSGTRDFAMSSVVFTHARMLKLGVNASLYIIEGGTHMAHVVAAGTPEADDAQAYIARWFLAQLE